MRLRTIGLVCGAATLAACSPAGNQPAKTPADAAVVASEEAQTAAPVAIDRAPVASASPTANTGSGSATPASTTPMSLTGWTGQWFGPEGLLLDIQPDSPGRVRINLKDSLDTSGQYVGQVNSDSISFERRGVTETLRRGIGAETGYSFLRSRKDCVIVRTNQEGYCRRAAAPTTTSALTPWVGRWQGPEGLFMDVQPGPSAGQVRLTIKDNLDDQDTYVGRFDGSAIRFDRRGRTETVRRGAGSETGFSFLRSRRDCLIVVAGSEGYCRPA